MQVVSAIAPLRARIAAWRTGGERIGFVPTMGNLHRGHLRLVEDAFERAQRVVVSVFVNPMQFGPGEDFQSYPRTPDADRQRLTRRGVDLLFAPPVRVIYPRGAEQTTQVVVPGVSEGLCGDLRPGHFTGVATVVARLLNLVQPDVAVFGEKDFQQLAVIRRMVEDLCWPTEIAGVATVREEDGLALSSRNQYLTAEQRRRAPLLYRTLCEVAAKARSGQVPAPQLEAQAMEALRRGGFEPEYVAIRDAVTLEVPASADSQRVVLAAARLGRSRLIDNVRV
ncbi:MAG: pantoate--beta-alanine ligase [Gammaproteobacteria bacterium]|jgi:pantoate--beta-alanine ligase